MRAHIDDHGMAMTVIGSTVEGERVAPEIEGQATLKDGTAYRNQLHILYVVRDGRIIGLKEYYDTARAIEI
jgi:ketosteroid isomerase-like protein